MGKINFDYTMQDIFWKALRYDWGRHSITKGDVAQTMLEHIELFDKLKLEVIAADIRRMLKEREMYIEKNYGEPDSLEIYEYDVKPFVDLEKAIRDYLRKSEYYGSL